MNVAGCIFAADHIRYQSGTEDNFKIPGMNIICSQAPEQSPGTEEDGVLWITDQGQRAQELLRFDCPVLAWLHEHNRDQNFSGVRYACENLEELDWDYMEKVYRRYMGIPWDILTTDRCLVRRPGQRT